MNVQKELFENQARQIIVIKRIVDKFLNCQNKY